MHLNRQIKPLTPLWKCILESLQSAHRASKDRKWEAARSNPIIFSKQRAERKGFKTCSVLSRYRMLERNVLLTLTLWLALEVLLWQWRCSSLCSLELCSSPRPLTRFRRRSFLCLGSLYYPNPCPFLWEGIPLNYYATTSPVTSTADHRASLWGPYWLAQQLPVLVGES